MLGTQRPTAAVESATSQDHVEELRSDGINRIVTVQNDYDAQGPGEISLKKGEKLRLRQCNDDTGFEWKVPTRGRRVMVPKNNRSTSH